MAVILNSSSTKEIQGKYEVWNQDLMRFHKATMWMAEKFRNLYIEHSHRRQNAHADALASLATSLATRRRVRESVDLHLWPVLPQVSTRRCTDSNQRPSKERGIGDFNRPSSQRLEISVHQVCLFGVLANVPKEVATIKHKAPRFHYNTMSQHFVDKHMMDFYFVAYQIKRRRKHSRKLMVVCAEPTNYKRQTPRFHYNAMSQTLYRRTQDGHLLRCLSNQEAHEALKEAHDGVCWAHKLGPKLGNRIQRMRYYWPGMMSNAITYAKHAMCAKFMGTLCTNPQSSFTSQTLLGYSKCGA